jgi:hypothetical protein
MRVEGFIVVKQGSTLRQYRDSNNAIVWLRQLDRQDFPGSVTVMFPESLGGGWHEGTPRKGIEAIERRIDGRVK